MKVLYINYIPSPYRIDFFNTLAKECDLEVLYYNKEISERPGWKYKHEDHKYKHSFLFKEENKIELSGYKKLYKYLKSEQYDIIVVGGYARPIEMFAITVLKFSGKPFILNTDGGFANPNPIKLKMKRWLVGAATQYLASGKVAGETLQYYGANKEKICNYRFSSIFEDEILDAPLTLQDKKQIRKKLDIPETGKIAITIGRYIPLKGFEFAIEAINKLNYKNTFLYMLGEGELRGKYNSIIEEHGLNDQVFLLGEQSKETVLEYCKAADVMILPTITSDVWGLVINEAMSCGLPVIATNRVGAAHDMVIENKTGHIVNPRSSGEIKQALEKVFKKPEEYSDNVLNIAKDYTIEAMVKDHLNCFNKFKAGKQ